MDVRELTPEEWAHFFDCFSRRFRGRRMTLKVGVPHGNGDERILAEQLPLMGITAEPRQGQPEAIEVMLGDSTGENVVHTVRRPTRVRVAQLADGQDDQVIIEEATGHTTRVDIH